MTSDPKVAKSNEIWKLWRIASDSWGNVHDWDEGNDGKGIIDDQGHVFTWNADEFPYHGDWMREHPDVIPAKKFDIDHDGTCRGMGMGEMLGQYEKELLEEADPRLNVQPEQEGVYNFG